MEFIYCGGSQLIDRAVWGRSFVLGVAKKGAPDIFDRRRGKGSKNISEVRQEYTVKAQGSLVFFILRKEGGGSSCFLNRDAARDS